jgi:hypothetical protein
MNGQYDTSGPVDRTGMEMRNSQQGAGAATNTAPANTNPNNQAVLVTNPAAHNGSLLNQDVSEHFRNRWGVIQAKFVDEPRAAVQQADALVTEVIDQITQMFEHEHSTLEGQWNQGSEVSTEDLRQALQHYRSFFNRLVV